MNKFWGTPMYPLPHATPDTLLQSCLVLILTLSRSESFICLYVNEVILALSESGHDCYFDNKFVGCIVYNVCR